MANYLVCVRCRKCGDERRADAVNVQSRRMIFGRDLVVYPCPACGEIVESFEWIEPGPIGRAVPAKDIARFEG